MLTWRNRHSNIIGDGLLWDSGHTAKAADCDIHINQGDPVTKSEDTGEPVNDSVEVDLVDQDTFLDVNNNNITRVDPHNDRDNDKEDVVESWEDTQDFVDGDVDAIVDIEPAIMEDPVLGTTGGPSVEPVKVGSGWAQRVRNPPKPQYEPSIFGKKYGYAMAVIIDNLCGKTADESSKFMGHELREVGEHHRPEVIGMCMAQLSMKAAGVKFGKVRTKNACMKEVKQIHMRDTFVPKHWDKLTPQQ